MPQEQGDIFDTHSVLQQVGSYGMAQAMYSHWKGSSPRYIKRIIYP